MTEREDQRPPADDDSPWSGEGEAPAALARLEALVGEARLRAPLSVPRRRLWPAALVAGGLVAAVVVALAPPRLMAPDLAARLLPGVSTALDVAGGSTVDVAVEVEEPGAAWRAELDRRLSAVGARASGTGARLSIEVPGLEPAMAAAWLTHAMRSASLEVVAVVDGSDYMKAVHERATRDPRAAALGVTAEVDSWLHEDGRSFTDWYLRAPDLESLSAYVSELIGEENDGPMPPERGRQLVPELPGRGGARTYYTEVAPFVERKNVAAAVAHTDPRTGIHDVRIELTAEAARRFANRTEQLVGHKIAILIDGIASSAPVVQEGISGGQLTIQVGGSTRDENLLGAIALAAQLQPTPLPIAVEVLGARRAGVGLSLAQMWVARGLLGLLAGVVVAGLVLAAARLVQPVDPEVARSRGRAGSRRVAARKLAVTAGGVALAAATPFVPMPGLGPLRDQVGSSPALGLGALGLGSVISAFVLVEVAALLVPRWRRLRVGPPRARELLALAAGVLGVALLVAHAYLLVSWLSGFGRGYPVSAAGMPLVVEDSRDFVRLVGLYLAGSAALLALAVSIERWGMANGFTCVLIGGSIASLVHASRNEPPASLVRELTALLEGRLAAVAGIVLVALLTAIVLRRRARPGEPTFRMPTAGLVPNGAAVSIGAGLSLLALWPRAHVEQVQAAWARLWGHPASATALVVVVAVALSWVFSRPEAPGGAVSVVDGRAGRRRWASFARATAPSVAYVGALFGIDLALVAWAPQLPVSAVVVALATALFMDGLAEWRAFRRRDDLVPVWPLHQVQRADALIDALARAGIDVHARSLYLRSLLHFFGPHVPILLHVPADRRDEAVAILLAQTGSPPPPAPSDEMRGASQAR